MVHRGCSRVNHFLALVHTNNDLIVPLFSAHQNKAEKNKVLIFNQRGFKKLFKSEISISMKTKQCTVIGIQNTKKQDIGVTSGMHEKNINIKRSLVCHHGFQYLICLFSAHVDFSLTLLNLFKVYHII